MRMDEKRAMGVPQGVIECLTDHAEATYPHECFGFLLGRFGEGSIQAAFPGKNANTSRPHDRYEMDPLEFLQAQTEAEEWGGDVIGFYHSHPNDQAIPSTYDRERAWEEYLYLIIPVADGQAGGARLWQLEAPEGPFSEMTLHSVGTGKERREGSCPS
jgi:proteasome lid subunit RPN8/RPN11